MLRRITAAASAFFLTAGICLATETENYGIRVLPTPGAVKVDGAADDWDLTGGIFACNDVERQRDLYSVWFHAMYDSQNLYLLARYNDKTPLNNPGDTGLEFGWNGDCLQIRVVTDFGTPDEQQSVFNTWKGRDGLDVVEMDSPPRTKKSPKGEDVKPQGAQQAFSVQPGKGYYQEIAIPWKLLTKSQTPPAAGKSIVLTIEPNFTVNANSRLSIKDVFRPGATVDRVFTFMAKASWGEALLLPAGKVAPQAVRLSDGRQFSVKFEDGKPEADWTGLIKDTERPGIKPIKFTVPENGYVSLVIRDDKGEIVRQLLTAEPRPKGENTIKWDGLTTFDWKTPGEPVKPGTYRWSAIFHPGIGLKLNGFVANNGTVPWDNGPGTNWGGDMAPPSSAASDGENVLLGWAVSEAGKAAVLCDLNGKPIWSHKRGGFGGATFVGLDKGVALIVDQTVFYKLKVSDATLVNWTASGQGELSFRELMKDPTVPARPDGVALRAGKLYVSSSNFAIEPDDITDWRAMLTQVTAAKEAEGGKAIWAALPEDAQKRVDAWLQGASKNADDLRAVGNSPDIRGLVIAQLNVAVSGPMLDGNPGQAAAADQFAGRQKLEGLFAALGKRASGFVAIFDAATGALEHKVTLVGAGKLAADAKGAFAIVSGKSLVSISAAGESKVVADNVPGADSVAVDAAGNFYIGSFAEKQVLVYSPAGQRLREIGKKGGRAPTGKWDAEALRNISTVTVDSQNHLWVGEALFSPMRYSKWDAATGKLLNEYFGPTHYGASGGSVFPSDPTVLIGEACEWKLDAKTGRGVCVGVFDTQLHAFTRFIKGSNGRDYLAAIGPSYIGGGMGRNNIQIFERTAPGEYKLRSKIQTLVKGESTEPGTKFWSDKNNDQQEQPDEVQKMPTPLTLGGYYVWSMWMNTDFTLYGGMPANAPGAMQVKVSGFTEAGAPLFDVAGAKVLETPSSGGGLSSQDNRFLLVAGRVESKEGEFYSLVDLRQNKKLWSYPNGWSGVHGSHKAPPPEPGLLRGVFGIVGSAKLPEPIGDIFALNTNLGEWHLLTRDGFYLSKLFESDFSKLDYPKDAVPGAMIDSIPPGLGMEDFGGSLQQAADGRVFVQSGKTAVVSAEVTGLDKIQVIPGGSVTISADDIAQAAKLRESLLQQAAGIRQLMVNKMTPALTGDLLSDFKGAAIFEFAKTSDTAVRAALTHDDQNLYLAWDVQDLTPWVNSADAAEYMYARGDTVDFQLATDPKADPARGEAAAGDLRLSIGQVAGKPTAVIYRKVAATPDQKKPKTFSSGIIREYVMESVMVVPDAKITVKKHNTGKGYTVEASVPLSVLGLTLSDGLILQGDIGVTHSNPGGDDTRLRSYWSNQETGLVDDEVYELMMKPSNWGQLKF